MISVNEAKEKILGSVNLTQIVQLSLSEAFGHVLAQDVISKTDIPNFAQSSMDGYAFAFEDRNKALKIIGEMAAGTSQFLVINKGEATRIFTGAPLPKGADTVIMQEKAKREADHLILEDDKISKGLHVRPKGAEAKKGEVAMEKETYLSAAALGFLAGIGCTHVSVYQTPSVALILTGNELQQPGKPLEFGQVYEANSISLGSALKRSGIENYTLSFAGDSQEQVEKAINDALKEHDIVLLNGGVSVGDYDYVVPAALSCGVTQRFHKIKQKPGKPLFFGTKGDKLIFGLPGNPSSSLTCFYEYVLPALEKIMHRPASLKIVEATLTHDYVKAEGLAHFIKAYYAKGEVTPLHAQESFRLHSFAQANCFIFLDEHSQDRSSGAKVEIHLLPL